MNVIFWFRNDLRLSDNQGLISASQVAHHLIPLFIFDPKTSRFIGEAQHWWLHHSLVSLKDQLKKKGITLLLKKGDANKILFQLIKKYHIDAIYWNRRYEPEIMKRDKSLITLLKKKNINVEICNGNLLIEPHEIKNKSGGYFKVFTPYWRCVKDLIDPQKILSPPKKLSQKLSIKTDNLNDWNLLPTNPDWSQGFKIWTPGEKGAQATLKKFIKQRLHDYPKNRDRPDIFSTSHLSPYLHFGEISVQQIWIAIKQAASLEPKLKKSSEAYLRQLIWREFSYYLLWHFPQLSKKNFQEKFNRFKWKKSKKYLKAWQKGYTGYPIVDAGMRELWITGYMHNRVRMITASFLIKDLLIDWREGEKWFWNTLLDADLANNSFGWQWVAGSGADAAPYFRIFNPVLQGKKFDPDGEYIKKWLPQLANLPIRYIHCPFNAPQKILNDANVRLGKNYPFPIVDHDTARQMALKIFRTLK